MMSDCASDMRGSIEPRCGGAQAGVSGTYANRYRAGTNR